ncbi:MAG: DNA-processing protein DprA [Elusimicrobia bacterium]|nr:DNA-processing protein DprA [Elusimicrobiota bacterium]MBP9698608.1 DNA-processing protein DprA [Elusimicrobiota bacterium]
MTVFSADQPVSPMFPTNEKDARHLINLTDSIGPVRFARLVERFGSAVDALRAGAGPWKDVDGFGVSAGDYFQAVVDARPRWEEEKKKLTGLDVRILCALDDEYPEPFRTLRDAPPILYVRGVLKHSDSIGVALVGSRRSTAYGVAAAERLGRELAQVGVTVVSGLARGIDGAAHSAALKAGGRTVGILGSGFERFYPPEHRRLSDQMAEKGAVITEFPLTAGPDAGHFPRRNRLIAALSVGTVVVEAYERSGALITAGLAAELGRDVFAVPGSIFSPVSRGPHRLIKNGAKPVESAMDILDEIRVFHTLMAASMDNPVSAEKKEPVATTAPRSVDLVSSPSPTDSNVGAQTFAPAEAGQKARAVGEEGRMARRRALIGELSLTPRGIDGLACALGLSASETARELLKLELAGLVRALPGKQYVRTEISLTTV